MTDLLARWLLMQIAVDEVVAREAASPAPWVVDDQQREDRAIYGAARGATVAYDPAGDEDSQRDFAHIVNWDPARVLAECDAKRRIVELHTGTWMGRGDPPSEAPYCPLCSTPTRDKDLTLVYPCDTLKLLALPYADRPGYREEWKPRD